MILGVLPDGIKVLSFLDAFYMHLWALCTTILHAQANTHSLVASLRLPNLTTYLIISSVMSSSFGTPINYFVNSLSYSLYSHSATFVHNLSRLIAFPS